MALSKEEIFEAIKELPVLELAGLVKDLEEEFGPMRDPNSTQTLTLEKTKRVGNFLLKR